MQTYKLFIDRHHKMSENTHPGGRAAANFDPTPSHHEASPT